MYSALILVLLLYSHDIYALKSLSLQVLICECLEKPVKGEVGQVRWIDAEKPVQTQLLRLTVSVMLCTDSNTAPQFFLSNTSTTKIQAQVGGLAQIGVGAQ